MNLSLKGRHALVCGGSKGIGLAAAQAMAALGATITLLSRSREALMAATGQLDTAHGQMHSYLVCDLSQPMTIQAIVSEHVRASPVHILVNNAGGPKGGPLVDADPEQFLQGFNTHVISGQILTQLILPGMQEAGYGRIINIISTSVKQPIPNLGVSNTIRGAMGNWAKTLAGEVGRYAITVNNVLPGMTTTDRLDDIIENGAKRTGLSEEAFAEQMKGTIPLRRFAAPGEIGDAVAFLASPAAGYITGTNLVVDGGRTGNL